MATDCVEPIEIFREETRGDSLTGRVMSRDAFTYGRLVDVQETLEIEVLETRVKTKPFLSFPLFFQSDCFLFLNEQDRGVFTFSAKVPKCNSVWPALFLRQKDRSWAKRTRNWT